MYDPRKGEDWFYNQQTLFTRYQQALDATKGMYLTYDGSAFDAQYRDISRNPTNGTTAPHLGIVDPAGDYHSDEQSKTGLPKKNANHWATGDNHGNALPKWNHLQILVHYYTGIQVRNANNNNAVLTPDFRWDMLLQQTDPVSPAPGSTFVATVVIQNTGVETWPAGSGCQLYAWWANRVSTPLTAPSVVYTLADQVDPGDIFTANFTLTQPSATSWKPHSVIYRLTGPLPAAGSWPQPNFDPAHTRANATTGPVGQIAAFWQGADNNAGNANMSIVADDNRAYFPSSEGLQAVQLATGQVAWTCAGAGDGVLAGGNYIFSSNTQLTGLNTTTGSQVWNQTVQGTARRPVAETAQVYVATALPLNPNPTGVMLYKFRTDDGVASWSQPAALGTSGQWRANLPQPPAIADGVIYLAYQNRDTQAGTTKVTLAALAASSGSLSWQVDLATTSSGTSCYPLRSPLAADSRAVVALTCNGSYQVVAVDLSTHMAAWQLSPSANPTLAYTVSPAQVLVAETGQLRALNAATGQLNWSWTRANGLPVEMVPLVVAADSIWITSSIAVNNWQWHLLAASNGAERARWHVGASNTFGQPNNSPAYARGLLLFSSGSRRWALSSGGWFNQAIPPLTGDIVFFGIGDDSDGSDDEKSSNFTLLPLILKN